MRLKESISDVINKALNIIISSILVALLIFNLYSFTTGGIFEYFILLASFVIILIVLFGFIKKISIPEKGLMTIFAVGIILRVLYGILIHPPIVSDQEVCLNAAKSVCINDWTWTQDTYFERWAYQIPFVLYESIVIKAFNSVNALFVANAIFGIISAILCFYITKETTGNNEVSLTIGIIFLLMPSLITKTSVIYNQTISLMFVLAAVYLFLKLQNKCENIQKITVKYILYGIACGAVLGIGALFRTNAAIVLISFVLFLIYRILFLCEKKYLYYGMVLLSILIGYFSVTKAVDLIVTKCISPFGISNGCPLWFLICGLTPDNHGQYSTTYSAIVAISDKKEQVAYFKNAFEKIFAGRSIPDTIRFFAEKIYYMWGDYNYEPSNILTVADKMIYMIIIILSLIGVICHRSKEKKNRAKMIVYIPIIGYFLSYIFLEAGVRYRYEATAFIIVLSAYGLIYLKNKFLCSEKQ